MTVKDKMMQSEEKMIDAMVLFALKALFDNGYKFAEDKEQDAIDILKAGCKEWLTTETDDEE